MPAPNLLSVNPYLRKSLYDTPVRPQPTPPLPFDVEGLAAKIAETHNSNGGSSIHPFRGDLSGTAAYAYSDRPSDNWTRDSAHGPLTKDEVKAYILRHIADLAKGSHIVGSWEEGGKHYLDLSKTSGDLKHALEDARRHGQRAIFDLKNFADIPVPGITEENAHALKTAY